MWTVKVIYFTISVVFISVQSISFDEIDIEPSGDHLYYVSEINNEFHNLKLEIGEIDEQDDNFYVGMVAGKGVSQRINIHLKEKVKN